MASFDTARCRGQLARMTRKTRTTRESETVYGGIIPGSGGAPAFVLVDPSPSALPVLLAAPHGGRDYPDSLRHAMRNPGMAAMRLEDRYVDRIAELAARETGASLLVARAPRAMIDLNRSPDDLDCGMVRERQDVARDTAIPGWRTRSGLGLIPRRLAGLGDIWKGPLAADDVAERIAGIHAPYHQALGDVLTRMRDRWGAALLLDIHSMPPLPARLSGAPPPTCVLGDRFGSSCHGGLASAACDYLDRHGLVVAHNRPYAGGYVLERHGDPAHGIHAVQIELCRSLYLDAQLAEPGEGLVAVAGIIAGLVRKLAEQVAAMGHGGQNARPWGLAAE